MSLVEYAQCLLFQIQVRAPSLESHEILIETHDYPQLVRQLTSSHPLVQLNGETVQMIIDFLFLMNAQKIGNLSE